MSRTVTDINGNVYTIPDPFYSDYGEEQAELAKWLFFYRCYYKAWQDLYPRVAVEFQHFGGNQSMRCIVRCLKCPPSHSMAINGSWDWSNSTSVQDSWQVTIRQLVDNCLLNLICGHAIGMRPPDAHAAMLQLTLLEG